MKVLCVHQGHELYGSDRSFISSVELIRDAFPTASVDVLIPREGDLAAALRRISGVRTLVDEIGSVRSADASRPLSALRRTVAMARRAAQRAAGYDALYVNTIVVADYILASRFVRARSVVHVREIPDSRTAKLAFSLLLAASPGLKIFNSERTRRSYWFLRPASSRVIHNGVDGLPVGPVDPNPGAPLRVLLIGRINSWKGHGLLLATVARLSPEERRQFRIRIVGDVAEGQAALRLELEQQVRACGLGDVVEMSPFAADPTAHYHWADVVAVPSTRPEPFGRVAVEAMSAGRAVVAAGHGGLVEIVSHGVTGLVFRPNDPTDLLDCLRSLQADRVTVVAMGQAGRRRFEADFSVQTYRRNLQRALESVFA